MNTKNNSLEKRAYSAPQMEQIKLDNEISLVLSSLDAPGDPEVLNAPEYFNNDPFKTSVG